MGYKMGLDNLIGEKITTVTVSDDKEAITFETEEYKYIYEALGDCCSHSWIECIEDIDNIVNQTILKIEENKISREYDSQYECLDIMNYDLYTEKGICKIDFRNSSNGYYGGYLKLINTIEKENK